MYKQVPNFSFEAFIIIFTRVSSDYLLVILMMRQHITANEATTTRNRNPITATDTISSTVKCGVEVVTVSDVAVGETATHSISPSFSTTTEQ